MKPKGKLPGWSKSSRNSVTRPWGIDCPGIDGLIKEADDVAGEVDNSKVLDAAIIGSAKIVPEPDEPAVEAPKWRFRGTLTALNR